MFHNVPALSCADKKGQSSLQTSSADVTEAAQTSAPAGAPNAIEGSKRWEGTQEKLF